MRAIRRLPPKPKHHLHDDEGQRAPHTKPHRLASMSLFRSANGSVHSRIPRMPSHQRSSRGSNVTFRRGKGGSRAQDLGAAHVAQTPDANKPAPTQAIRPHGPVGSFAPARWRLPDRPAWCAIFAAFPQQSGACPPTPPGRSPLWPVLPGFRPPTASVARSPNFFASRLVHDQKVML